MKRLRSLLAPFLGLIFVIALFSALVPESFPTLYNFRTVSTQTVVVGLGAIGMSFVIVSGGIDLSVGSVIALSSVSAAAALNAGWSAAAAILAAIATGALCGLVNGLLIARLRIMPFIATLGMMGVARGAAKRITGGQKIDAPASWLPELVSKSSADAWLGLPPGLWILLALAALMAAVLRRTPFGLHVVAIGSNEATARLCGVNVAGTLTRVYVLCGAFAGLAGAMLFGRLSVGEPTAAVGMELDVIAACVIGGASLSGGEGGMLGAMIGAFLMAFLANGMNLAQVENYWQEILIGVIIVAAVALDRWRHRRA